MADWESSPDSGWESAPDTPKAEKTEKKEPKYTFDSKGVMVGRSEPVLPAKDIAGAAIEPMVEMATGAIGSAVGGYAGLASAATHAAGLTKEEPAETVSRVKNALTYQPRTEGGKNASAAINYIPGKFSEASEWAGGQVTDKLAKAGLPAPVAASAGNVVGMGPQVLASLFGLKSSKEFGKLPLEAQQKALDVLKGENAVKDATRRQSQAAGFVTPVEGPSWIAGIPGFARLNKAMSEANFPKWTRKAVQSLGLKEGTTLSVEELENYREKFGGPYEEVKTTDFGQRPVPQYSKMVDPKTGQQMRLPDKMEKAGLQTSPAYRKELGSLIQDLDRRIQEFPETNKSLTAPLKLLKENLKEEFNNPSDVIENIKRYRKEAGINFKAGAKGDVEKLEVAFTQKYLADALEGVLDSNLERVGKPDLMARVREARKAIAKSYAIQYALNESTGFIDPNKLKILADRGTPLSDQLKIIADYARAFPEGAKVVTQQGRATPWDYLIAVGSTGAGIATGNPMVALPGIAEFAGRVGVPMLAQRGLLQKRTPNYTAKPTFSEQMKRNIAAVAAPETFSESVEKRKKRILDMFGS